MEGYGALPPYVAEWMAEVRHAGGKVTRPCPTNAEQAEAHRKKIAERRAIADAARRAKDKYRLDMIRRIERALARDPSLDTTLKVILVRVAHKHGVDPFDVVSDRRFNKFVHARQEYFYLARMRTKHSLPAIGREAGGRDHSTVRHGIIAHCERNDLPLPPDVKPRRTRR